MGSGQPRVLQTVGARTAVVLQGWQRQSVWRMFCLWSVGTSKEGVSQPSAKISSFSGRTEEEPVRSVSYQNTQARQQHSQGASQAFTSPQPYQHQYHPQGFTQNFQTPQASRIQGGCGYSNSGPGSSSSCPGQGRGNKGKGKVTSQAYAFTGEDDTQDHTG
ncbi:hypothetical protein PanWU01x14_336110 [Parasponia andersonii]|uniref:Uncharacterized protein n=1 Tax=Parasponia andersonii TaxID=3476 RepID=A0A2P5AFY5_PARAD|nr:hypothetical protein PanWU01x14_336110 [Parasponia andersonii]